MPSGIACTCGNKSAPMVVLRMLVGSLAIRFPAMGGLVAAVGCADKRTFVGSLYGVSARVNIDMISRIADVELSGVPVGGRVAGRGWFASKTAEAGPVELEEAFFNALRRRRISIVRAALDRQKNTITVVTNVPVLGSATLILKPETPAESFPLCTPAPDLG